jgi:hypothetical protein
MVESRAMLVQKNPFAALLEVLRFMISPKKAWPGVDSARRAA